MNCNTPSHLSDDPRLANETAFSCTELVAVIAALTLVAQPAQGAVTEAWVQRYSNVVSNSNDSGLKLVRDGAGDIIVTGTTEGTSSREVLTIKYSGVDGSLMWQHRYKGPTTPQALAVDASGNVALTGYSWNGTNNDYYTAKYAAADGALLWEKRYNGPGNRDDVAQAVAVDARDNVVVTGYSYDGAPNYDTDYYTAKYAARDGALLWEQRYNGPANGDDQGRAVAVDANGNVVVTGHSHNSNGGIDYYTAKYAAADAALLWEQRYKGPSRFNLPEAVAVDVSGNVVVTGWSDNALNPYGDYYTAKYAAADGALLWEQRYNGPGNRNDYAIALAVDGSGNVAVTGYSSNGTNDDYYTAMYAATDGALFWEQRYNGPGNSIDVAQAVAVDSSGNVVVTGASRNSNDDWEDYYTAKYAARDGALLWEKRYDGPANRDDVANAVTVDDSGNVVVIGRSRSGGNLAYLDYYTAKYAAGDGTLLWEKRYNGPSNGNDVARSVAVDNSGRVAVTGYSIGTESDYDYYTAKYAAEDGVLLWEQRYNGSANDRDFASAVAVDSDGNVIVTGYSFNGTNTDYYTAKYAAADGALVWQKHYDGRTNSYDEARALAVDRSRNVIVTGDSYDSSGNSDLYTVKYAAADGMLLWEKRKSGGRAIAVALDDIGNVVVTGSSKNEAPIRDLAYYTARYAAADGALLWEKRYNGPGNGEDQARAVAVDGNGNAVVTGYSYNGAPNADFYTAKYAVADGALLWEQRYNGSGNSNDFALALAVDGSGNVAVTGSSSNGTNDDYYTAKYAAADGALLWEQRYDGSGKRNDRAHAVAVDSIGNVVVTGYSWNGTNDDYYTAKYAAADGALLWEKRYHGGVAISLALSSNGTIVITGSSNGDYATVAYREDLPAVSIDLVLTGVRLRFAGGSGSTYRIERAPTATGPWGTLATLTAPVGGLIEYIDTAPLTGSAFYRVASP